MHVIRILWFINFHFLDFCDKSNWDDIKEDCGGCKALIDNMITKYKTCQNYCETVGMVCLKAYEETNGNCRIDTQHACNEIVNRSLNTPSNDVICECQPGDKNGKQIYNQCYALQSFYN